MTYTKKIYKTARDTLNFFLWFCWTKSIKKIHIDLRCARARGPQGTYKARTSEINFILSKVQKWQFLPPHEKFWAKSWKYPKSYAFVIYKRCLFANPYIGQKFKKITFNLDNGPIWPVYGPGNNFNSSNPIYYGQGSAPTKDFKFCHFWVVGSFSAFSILLLNSAVSNSALNFLDKNQGNEK